MPTANTSAPDATGTGDVTPSESAGQAGDLLRAELQRVRELPFDALVNGFLWSSEEDISVSVAVTFGAC